jgi:hypothetical protein
MNFNEWKKHQAEKLGAVVSHDEDPLSLVGSEGNDLGAAARAEPFDPGNTNPSQSSPSTEHTRVSSLPTSTSASQVAADSLRRERLTWGGGNE